MSGHAIKKIFAVIFGDNRFYLGGPVPFGGGWDTVQKVTRIELFDVNGQKGATSWIRIYLENQVYLEIPDYMCAIEYEYRSKE